MSASNTTKYTSKIIKAGALLPDTKMLLAHWDQKLDRRANLARMRQDNIFGKASRSRIRDILVVFRQRYLSDPDVLKALLILVERHVPAQTLDTILYYLSMRSDALLYDAVTEVLFPRISNGQNNIHVDEMEQWIRKQVNAGKSKQPWGDETIERCAQGIMATLRDFGVLQGKVNKQIASLYLPTSSFAFIAFLLNKETRSGERLLNHPDWRLFFLSQQAVERFFLEAHQNRLLEYHAAGRVIRIDFPAKTIEEYAHVVAQRAY
jgi:hypothetical protein